MKYISLVAQTLHDDNQYNFPILCTFIRIIPLIFDLSFILTIYIF